MQFITTGILAFIFSIIAFWGGYIYRKNRAGRKISSAKEDADTILSETKTKAKELQLAAKDKAISIIENAKKEEEQIKAKIFTLQEKIEKREEKLDRELTQLQKNLESYRKKELEIEKQKEDIELIKRKQVSTLEKVASLTREDAQGLLLRKIEEQSEENLLARLKKLKQKEQAEIDKEARDVITRAVARLASSVANEYTSTTVTIPNEEMKGRIIGKEGRNIRVIEQLTGCEIVVDDTPGAILISGFSPVRRHIAKNALDKLILDGRIQPAKIEEYVEKAKQEIALDMKEAGEQALYELGIVGYDPKLVQLVGRLKYRTSYGQNQLQHSIEVAKIARLLAEELGADKSVAMQGALLHDIGKAVDHEIEGNHHEIGLRIARKFKLPEEVVHTIEASHEDVDAESVEAFIVRASDAISGARVGARKDDYEDYIKRLEAFEDIGNSFEGVEKTYAIQAGREIRLFVKPEAIDDYGQEKLASEVARKIEKEMNYPGDIKVVVIREKRVIEYAR